MKLLENDANLDDVIDKLNMLAIRIAELEESINSTDELLAQHDQEIEVLENAVFEEPDRGHG